MSTAATPRKHASPPRKREAEYSGGRELSSEKVLPNLLNVSVFLAALSWVYWPNLVSIQARWESTPQYSHGYLVPIFSLILLYTRRESFLPSQWAPSWGGVFLLGCGLGLKLASSYYFIESLSYFSFLVSIAGVVMTLWGAKGLKWAFPGIAFLIFMLPLPYRIEVAMQSPLRSIGTVLSTYTLQTIGLPAFNEGHVIVVEDQLIGVAEACSGIRMLMVFFALSTAVAIVVSESWAYRIVILLSAIPIALIANVIRITSTGAMYVYLAESEVFGVPGPEFASRFFHDWAGWFMMPIALILLWIEFWILDHLTIRVPDRPLQTGITI